MKFKEFLSESSLGRIFQHQAKQETPFALLTAFRAEETEKQNIKNNKELAALVRKAGYGFFWVEGHWIENEDTDKEIEVSETSLFVIADENGSAKLKSNLIIWMKKYKQDAVLFRPGDSDSKAFLLFKTGKVDQLGKLTFGKIGSAYTKLRNNKRGTFVFEGTVEATKNWIHKISEGK